MPEHIKAEHVKRMFPFEFYEELSEQLNDYALLNPAFILQGAIQTTTKQRKDLFEESRKNAAVSTLHHNNLIQVEPFGELLTLEVCCPTKDRKIVLREPDKRMQMPMSIIVTQLYDSSGTPVFASDVDESSIGQIPEVLWDDPNLLLGVVSFTEEEPRVAVLKIPARIEEQLFESIQGDEQ
ncbi:hypothetical protein [Metabacillus sp. SLBN-84]